MAGDKNRIDRMAEILKGDTTVTAYHGVEELSQIILDVGRSGKKQSNALGKQGAKGGGKRKRTKVPKKKTTHYLRQEVFDELGDVKEKIKEMLPEGRRYKVSKSGIISQALKDVLRDFEEKGSKSKLVRDLVADNEPSKS